MASEKLNQATQKPFTYRCFVNKEYTKPIELSTVAKQFHLELGENGETKIVEDRALDFVELANKDVDNVGLANVLRLAAKGQTDLSAMAFQDGEATDLSGIDPMDPSSVKATISSQEANMKKLQSTADQLGCSVDDLVDAMLKGTLTEFISQKSTKTEEVKESV